MSTPAPSTPPRESPGPPSAHEGLEATRNRSLRDFFPDEQTGHIYSRINTREVLLIDREPWSLELYRLADGRLQLAAMSTEEGPTPLVSEVFPLAFRLLAGDERPALEIAQVGGEQVWRI